MRVYSNMLLFKATVFLSVVTLAVGFFEWKNCVKPIKEAVPKTVKVHGCEDGKEVLLSCAPGKKIAVTKVFFGHGNGYKTTCDSNWISQNCRTAGVKNKVKLLCQEKESCKINPREDVLGDTSCLFGLDADLFIDYVCNPVYVNDVISIRSMKLTPSPLILPGAINASISVLVKRRLASTTKVKLDIEKKVLGAAWIPIPCVSNYGSCTYDNFCEILRSLMFSKCDGEMENRGVSCDCPIPTGLFNVPSQIITVTKELMDKLPSALSWLVEGKYRITAEFLDVYDRYLGCIQLQVEIDINTK